MAEIVNLNRVRKRLARAAAADTAAANRIRHGRTRAERTRAGEEAERRARTLDGALLAPPPETRDEV